MPGYTWSDLLDGDWPTGSSDRALFIGLGVTAGLAVLLIPLAIVVAVVHRYLWTVAANAFYLSTIALFVAALLGTVAFGLALAFI